MLADPTNGFVDFAVFVSPQVEDIYLCIGLFDRNKDRIDAILHIQIRFSLVAVAEHVEMFGMLGKLLVKVEDMAVGIAFPENRHEAKNVGLQPKAFAIGLNQ